MGYIVDLTVILDQISRSATGIVSDLNDVQSAMDMHVSSGRRDRIHQDIRAFVKDAFPIRFVVPQRDPILEKVIDLFRQYCVPIST